MADTRLRSLDAFRGLAVFLMIAVNSGLLREVVPQLAHHRTFMSVADVVMPMFFVAVGFAYRLTFLRSLHRHSASYRQCCTHTWERTKTLLVLCVFHYGLWTSSPLGDRGDFLRSLLRPLFQTLCIIALTQLYLLPVIGRSARIMIAYAAGGAVVYVALSYLFWFEIAMTVPVIDGGALAFLSHAVEVVCGALLHDWSVDLARDTSARDAAAVSEEGVRLTEHTTDAAATDAAPADAKQEISTEISPVAPESSSIATKYIQVIGWIRDQFLLSRGSLTRLYNTRTLRYHLTLLCTACSLVALGYLLSCLPTGPICFDDVNTRTLTNCTHGFNIAPLPFVQPPPGRPISIWNLNQRAGSVTYHICAAGVSLLAFMVCHFIVDGLSVRIPYLELLGQNALLVYVTQCVPSEAESMWQGGSVLPFFGVAQLYLWYYVALSWLKRRNIVIKLG